MKSESSPDRRCSLTALMRCQRGNIVMLAALMIPVVISLAGMAIDLQFTVRQKEKVQHALDSAILAGALSRQNGADEETVTAAALITCRPTNPLSSTGICPLCQHHRRPGHHWTCPYTASSRQLGHHLIVTAITNFVNQTAGARAVTRAYSAGFGSRLSGSGAW